MRRLNHSSFIGTGFLGSGLEIALTQRSKWQIGEGRSELWHCMGTTTWPKMGLLRGRGLEPLLFKGLHHAGASRSSLPLLPFHLWLCPSWMVCVSIWALLLKWLTCIWQWYVLSSYTNLITLVFWDSLGLYWLKYIINLGYIHIIRGKFLWLHDKMSGKKQTIWDLWKSAVCAEKNQ